MGGAYELHRYWFYWLAVQLVVVTLDFSYMLLRPHTQPGGHWLLGFIFQGWHKYATIDKVYAGVDNAFGWGQSYMNVVENIGYVWALYQYRVKGNRKLGYIVWFGLLVATFSKTVLYALVEVGDSSKNVSHNPWGDFIFYYLFFNNIWVVVPFLWIFFVFGPTIYREGKPASAAAPPAVRKSQRARAAPASRDGANSDGESGESYEEPVVTRQRSPRTASRSPRRRRQ